MQCISKTFPYNDGSLFAARKTDIIRVTEQILDAINSGDFEGYTYVSSLILCILNMYLSSLISRFYMAFLINITVIYEQPIYSFITKKVIFVFSYLYFFFQKTL